ncbi:MAG TPA: MFS transporter [Terriglobia bacterium]|nr:MFS transporter [Terriglobia bacterium]
MSNRAESDAFDVAEAGAPGASASRVRYAVLALICSLSVITYLDRVCIAGSAPYITDDLGLTPVEMGAAFSAFAIAYALFEVPGGWLGDRIGPRKVISRIVVWWSMFTVFTGLVNRLWSLITVRFLFGAGEAGMYPNSAKVFSRWMPKVEQGFATGLMWMFGRMGGAFAPGLVVYLIARTGWRATFWIFGVVGMVWAVFFWTWFRDTPQEKAGVNEAEIRIIRAGQDGPRQPTGHVQVPWGRLLRSSNMWAIAWMYFCMAYGWYFYITWLPTYLKAKGASMMQAGIYGGMPLFFGAIGCLLGGLLTDYVVKKTGNLRNRRYIGFAGFFLGSICMMASAWIRDPLVAVTVISMASFFGDMTMGSCWAVCMDVGHELAGTVSGIMNMTGNFAGFLFPTVTGFLVQYLGSWDLPIIVSSAIFFLGALLWLRIDPTESVIAEPERATS